MRYATIVTFYNWTWLGSAQVVDQPCTAGAANSSVALSNWFQCAVTKFYPFPANDNWSAAYAEIFSPNLLASFNNTRYDYDGYLGYFHNVNTTIAATFSEFKYGFRDSVAVPSSSGDKGGVVFITGWQGGRTVLGTDIQFLDAAFAVVEDVGGDRKVVEIREASNTPSSVLNSGGQNWSCATPA